MYIYTYTVGKPKSPQSFETRKKQATAIVMLGVLGAEFGAEMEPNRRKSDNSSNKKNVAEGFGLSQYSHSMHTSKLGVCRMPWKFCNELE